MVTATQQVPGMVVQVLAEGRFCSIDGCRRKHKARGWCAQHYWRWQHYGSPKEDISFERQVTAKERFWQHVDTGSPNACWIWTGARNRDGYGHFYVSGKLVAVHRFSFELHKGPIPEGMEIDHLCRTHPCVNPLHLDAVSHQTNNRRGVHPNSFKNACSQGHSYDLLNTMYVRGKSGTVQRRCRQCSRLWHRKWKSHRTTR